MTATVTLSPEAIALVESFNRPGAFQAVEWTSEVKPAAAHKRAGIVLHKVTRATVRTGVDYANLAVNEGRETGDLPWGEWAVFPYIITHKGSEYVRLYTVDGSVGTRYYVNGEETDGDTFRSYLTEGARKARRPHGGTITVKVPNVTLR